MIDIVTVGFSGIQFIRDQQLGLILHGHRAMHAAFTHSERHGIAMLVIAKLARLAGIDELHTGTVIGKMEGTKEDILNINNSLRKDWFGMKPTLPIASGGLHPGLVPELVKILGSDIIINLGGGVHGHPKGVKAGACAARQAVEASVKGIDINEYAGNHKELKEALEFWDKEKTQEGSLNTYKYSLVLHKGLDITK